jgi:serine/threonine-protein kinase PpkA
MEIPGYRILDTLGKGGMATVYLAMQESFERKVAIKVMSPQLAQDPTFGERFQREAKIVSQMNHPNIVTVYDVGVVSNHHYLAMEYVPGRELRDTFKAMDLMDRIRAVKEVAAALNYAGNKGYVHRDVKPENVMICEEDGRAVLMDFGIAKTTDTDHSMTKTGMAIGTPYYMSPEQAQGKPVDKRSDIYSLGVTLFQMLTGRVPYDADSQVAIGIKHITEPVPFLPNHLRMFQPIINRVMAKDPNHRYQTGAELIKDLEKIGPADISMMDRLLQQDIEATTKTDPHAATVLADVTGAPPTLNTGNVTTADAARLATRIGTAVQSPPQSGNKHSPLAALIVIVVLLAGGGWFLSQQNTEPNKMQPAPAVVQSSVEPPAVAGEPLPDPATAEPVVNAAPVVAVAESESQKVDTTAAQAEEKTHQEALKAAEQQKKQEELARAEKAKVQLAAQQKQLQEKQRQETAKIQQAQLNEIQAHLKRADALREQGQLVSPEGNNAVLAYRAVLELDTNNAAATKALKEVENSYLIGVRYQIDQGKLDDAASKLQEAVKAFPNSAAVSELQALQQKKTAELAAARAAAIADVARPKINKLVVNDAAFDSMQLAQKTNLPVGRTAYVGFSYQDFQGTNSVLQAVLHDSARTVKIIQKPVVVSGAQGNVFFTLARPVEGFSDGGYSLDLLLNDQKLVTVEFLVKH